MSLLKHIFGRETETETEDQVATAPPSEQPDLDPFADYPEAIPEEEVDQESDDFDWENDVEDEVDAGSVGEDADDQEGVAPAHDDTHEAAVFVNGPKPRHRTLLERLSDDLARLRDRAVKLDERIAAQEAIIAEAKQKVQDRALLRERRHAAAKALSRPEPQSVPELFPRLSYAGRLWDHIAESAHQNALGDTEVSISLTRLARDWNTPRATVKHLIRAFIGKGVLVDLTPDANAAHVFKVVDRFGTLRLTEASAPQVEHADSLTEQDIAF